MKKILTILFLAPLFVFAQGAKFITHTVAAKENLSSIGRLYNINGRELAKYNNIDYDKGLSLGQVLKIPAANAAKAITPVATPATTAKIPAQTAPAPVFSVKDGTPVYHTVAKKETLYHISTLYNKVPIADLKKWNSLTGDGLSEGTRLIVGYTAKPKEAMLSATTKESVALPATPPVQTAPVTIKEAVKPKEPVKQAPVFIEDIKAPEVKAIPVNTSGKNFDGGIFKAQYSKAGKAEQAGTAGVFKSTSGWEDGKYYCLHNAAIAGSVIKITSTATNKSVYAKVLDVIPDLKQNSDIILRISNAAAQELGVGEANFECVVNY